VAYPSLANGEVAVLVEDVAAFLNATISQNTLGGLAGGEVRLVPGLDSDDAVGAYQDRAVLVLHPVFHRIFVSHGCRRPFPATIVRRW
jgi:hypothetical protein